MTAAGMVIGAHLSFEQVGAVEVLPHPGGAGLAGSSDQQYVDWVRQQRQRVPLMTSVCTGSPVYAAAGLLAGRPATTY